MKSLSEVSFTPGSFAAPPHPVSMRTMTESYILTYMKGNSSYLSASTIRKVEGFSLVHVKHVDEPSTSFWVVETTAEPLDDDVSEGDLNCLIGNEGGGVVRVLERNQSKQPILVEQDVIVRA